MSEHLSGPDLGAFALGGLTEAEARAVEAHVADCADCRRELDDLTRTARYLDGVPPEFFLDGAPEGGDLLVARTVAQVRGERAALARETNRRRWVPLAVAAAVVGALLAGGGVLAGRHLASTASSGTSTASPVPGTRSAAATNPATGARMSVAVVPAAGWVRIDARVAGIAAGQKCRLVVEGTGSDRVVAGSWLVSPRAARYGISLSGFALVAPADVRAVVVETVAGQPLISVPIH